MEEEEEEEEEMDEVEVDMASIFSVRLPLVDAAFLAPEKRRVRVRSGGGN